MAREEIQLGDRELSPRELPPARNSCRSSPRSRTSCSSDRRSRAPFREEGGGGRSEGTRGRSSGRGRELLCGENFSNNFDIHRRSFSNSVTRLCSESERAYQTLYKRTCLFVCLLFEVNRTHSAPRLHCERREVNAGFNSAGGPAGGAGSSERIRS